MDPSGLFRESFAIEMDAVSSYSPLTMALLDVMAKILFNSDETFSPIRIKVAPTDST